MPVTTQTFKGWLKYSNNMKISSDASAVRLTHEGVTKSASLSGFDKKSIENLPSVCKNSIPAIEADASNSIAAKSYASGVKISSMSVSRLITNVNAAKHYGLIASAMNPQHISYTSFLETFKIQYEACLSVKDEDDSNVPKINDGYNDQKIIYWYPIFKDCLSSSYVSRGPLIYVLREDPAVLDEDIDPLLPICNYGESGSLISELESRLPHTGPTFKNDVATVYMNIEEAARGTSVESTIKSFSFRKERCGAF